MKVFKDLITVILILLGAAKAGLFLFGEGALATIFVMFLWPFGVWCAFSGRRN